MAALLDSSSLLWHDHDQQLTLVSESVHDERAAVPTGVGGLDLLLRRGGFLPGSLVLLGGRTGTRKSTIMLNMMVSMAQAGISVGLVGLDEQGWQYATNLMSVLSGRSRDWVEERWDTAEGKALRSEYRDLARGRIHLYTGRRPDIQRIAQQVEMSGMGTSESPKVVFIDYLKLLTRDKSYGYKDNERIPRLVEDLEIWTTETGTSVVALHQLSRNDEFGGANNRNAGHLPVTLAQLMYGGEDSADMVMGTYRPSMDPVGNLTMDSAKQVLGDRFDEEDYWAAVNRVKKYAESTFLQLLKNRPGTHREEKGIELLSPFGDSLRMEEKDGHEPDGERAEQPTTTAVGKG